MTIQLFRGIREKLCLLLALVFCVFCTACEIASQAVPDSEEEEYYYSMKLQEIPDPDEALYESSILKTHENWWGRELRRIYEDGHIYRLLFLMEETQEGTEAFLDYCLQIYHEETGNWEQRLLSDVEWIENGFVNINGMVGATQEGVFLRITTYTADGEQEYLEYLDADQGRILMKWPEEVEEGTVYQDREENIYFVSATENAVYAYDSDGKKQKRVQLGGYLWGGICSPVTGDMLWYGSSSEGAHLWEELNWPDSYELLKEVEAYAFKIAYAPDGTLYYADADAIWIEGEQPRRIFSFVDSGYRLGELYSIRVLENGDIRCYVFLDGSLNLLSLNRETEETAQEQREITLSYNGTDIFLEQIVTRFNRQNPQYHITLVKNEDSLALQMELTSGQGPDLLYMSPLAAKDYIAQGYLQDMEGIIEDSSPFWKAALENGRVGGITYGIPYSCSLRFAVFSADVTGDRQSWTVEEMMQCVQDSDAGILDWYFSQMDAYNIVMIYGLYDNENTVYIDWEKGESHLNEQPFIELLEFAGKYADTGDYEDADILPMFKEEYIAGMSIHLWRLGLLDYAENCFSGNISYIGYPNSSGKKGAYVKAYCLYMNQASDQREGITEFIRFMLSEEAQELCVADGFCYSMPVRLSTISYLIEQEQKKAENPQTGADSWMSWQEDGLDEKQLEQLQELIKEAQPDRFYVSEVEDILSEELEPYFSGMRSVTDTVNILDNRIQLYLDERGVD